MYSDGGLGASEICVSMTVATLKRIIAKHLSPSSSASRGSPGDGGAARISVETTTSEEVISGKLSDQCCLLVMPGGRDLPYVDKLKGKGNENISQFVKNGGGYLGICAGAYYGCSSVQFAQGDPLLEVVGQRELSFFKGVSQGPVFDDFEYASNKGAMAADVQLTQAGMEMLESYCPQDVTIAKSVATPLPRGVNDDDVTITSSDGEVPIDNDSHIQIYYNGGCHFMDDSLNDESFQNFRSLTTPPSTSRTTLSNTNNYKVLGTYAAPKAYQSHFVSGGVAGQRFKFPLSALIASRYGRGRVVLSGVHFEASSDLLQKHYEDDPYIESLQSHIASSDEARERLILACVRYLLDFH